MVSASFRLLGRSAAEGGVGHIFPANQPVTTVMRFSVRVPVLSEQMAVAPPIVSHAAKTCKQHVQGRENVKDPVNSHIHHAFILPLSRRPHKDPFCHLYIIQTETLNVYQRRQRSMVFMAEAIYLAIDDKLRLYSSKRWAQDTEMQEVLMLLCINF